jgi:hypothetical protein
MGTGHLTSSGWGIPAVDWATRVLAAIGILVCGFATVSLFTVGGRQPMPFVSKGALLGTYAQSTQLGIFTLGAGFALSLVGAFLAFRWRRVAAGVLIAGGLVQTLLWAVWSFDRTRPPGDHGILMSLLVFAAPPFITAVLLLGNGSRRLGPARAAEAIR